MFLYVFNLIGCNSINFHWYPLIALYDIVTVSSYLLLMEFTIRLLIIRQYNRLVEASLVANAMRSRCGKLCNLFCARASGSCEVFFMRAR